MLKRRLFLFPLSFAILLALAVSLDPFDSTANELAHYIERKVEGENPLIAELGGQVAKTLHAHDRLDALIDTLPALKIGAQAGITVADSASKRHVTVNSVEQARAAIARAEPGDVMTFLPGTYSFVGNNISVSRPGLANAPIIVRAAQAGSVKLELALAEGFLVSAPYWIFENLHLHGACPVPDSCDHAFHVVGNAHHFIARNNTILDFNSHFKVNMENGLAPDDGVLDHNTLSNTETRNTERSVTLIDLVAASGWRIHHNLISDFIKDHSNKISYGVFAKGAGADNRIEYNLVICEHRLRNKAGQRVGISLGGGGTGQAYCRDRRCISEQDRGVIESNLIMSCSDDGIYLNKAASSRVSNNTLLNTQGLSVRFPESSADVEGNLVDGKIRARDGGVLHAQDNVDTNGVQKFFGDHSVLALFQNPSSMDLRWRAGPLKRPVALARRPPGSTDLCGQKRNSQSAPGAFDDFSACLQDPH